MRGIGSILAGGIIIILCGGLIMLGDMKVRPAAARAQSLNALRQIGLAMNSYHEAHGHFPAAAIRDRGQPGIAVSSPFPLTPALSPKGRGPG